MAPEDRANRRINVGKSVWTDAARRQIRQNLLLPLVRGSSCDRLWLAGDRLWLACDGLWLACDRLWLASVQCTHHILDEHGWFH